MRRTTLVQERSYLTRRALLTAAEELWTKHGFDSVTVDRVCERAHVSKGTFYFYFPVKEHLLVTLVFLRLKPSPEDVSRLLESDLDTAVICERIGKMMARHARRMQKHLVERAIEESIRSFPELTEFNKSKALRSFFEPIFLRGQERGEVSRDWSIDILVGLAGWGMLQGVLAWARNETTVDLAKDLCLRLRLIGIGAKSKNSPSQ